VLSILLGQKKMTTLQQLLVLDQIFPRGQQFEYGIYRNGGVLAAIVMSLINDELSSRGELSDFMRERCVEIFKFVVSPSTSTYTSTSASTSVAPFLDSFVDQRHSILKPYTTRSIPHFHQRNYPFFAKGESREALTCT